MNKTINNIMRQIAAPTVKCISFDVFDTVILRPVLYPSDVFQLVGNACGMTSFFSKRRMMAEKRAMYLKDYYKAYVNIDEIYDAYKEMFGGTPEEVNKIKQCELDIEYQISFQRKAIKHIYDFALMKGKKIIFTTDMYLSKEFIAKLLEKSGYREYYNLYVSNEVNATKRDGSLYEMIITDMEECGISSDEIVHIGDNKQSDIDSAIAHGIKAIYVPNIYDCFKKCKRLITIERWKSTVYPSSQTLMLGLYAAMVFDDPFELFDNDSRYNGNPEFLGFYLAPFIISFCLWLITESNRDNVDCMGMVWRDGYIPEKIIEKLSMCTKEPFPNIERVFLNRALRYAFVAEKKGGIFDSLFQWTLNPQTSLKEFAKNFIKCESDADEREVYNIFADHGYTSVYEGIGSIERYSWFIHELEPIFKKNHSEDKMIINQKIQTLLKANKLGIFDIGYRGTVSRFLADQYLKNNICYHMLGTMGSDEEIPGVVIKSFVQYDQSRVINSKNSLHKFMELVISEQIPSVLGYVVNDGKISEKLDPFFEIDETVLKIQKGILKYTEQFVEIFGEYIKYFNIDRYVLFTMINSALSSPNKRDAEVIKNLRVTPTHYASVQETFEKWYDDFFGVKK